ncbi:MAG: hypothetical protein OES53_13815 [Xanthomonadales bacterium]|jgi:hypothetical protein|nr:hypothetical protein [Xanthomonadales bacterium]MDH3923044.1 hypothetical protein [Xanthomonadales bacterium]MDH3942127.1 hypothetical protein [Xanthomonadales bacterium]MDH4001064.1 hypothetical protein [Xanthomonadales bacterium]
MDNPTTLLVAIMYVTIVATGLVNVLLALSDIVGGKSKSDALHTGWLVLLLLAYLSFFWETTAILDIEGWNFFAFLSFIIGPIALLFASNLVTSPKEVDEAPIGSYYFEQGRRFFLLLCLVQFWVIGLDVVFDSINYATYTTGGIAAVFLVLMVSKSHRLHVAGLVILLLAFFVRIIFRAAFG